jgi:hypothetical protein
MTRGETLSSLSDNGNRDTDGAARSPRRHTAIRRGTALLVAGGLAAAGCSNALNSQPSRGPSMAASTPDNPPNTGAAGSTPAHRPSATSSGQPLGGVQETQQFSAFTFTRFEDASGRSATQIPVGTRLMVSCVAFGSAEAAPSAVDPFTKPKSAAWDQIISPAKYAGRFVASNTESNHDEQGLPKDQPPVDPLLLRIAYCAGSQHPLVLQIKYSDGSASNTNENDGATISDKRALIAGLPA